MFLSTVCKAFVRILETKLRGAVGDLWVGASARTRIAGGNFCFGNGMLWYQNKIKNKKFCPRARTRNLQARPPQGGDLRAQALWLTAELSGLKAEGYGRDEGSRLLTAECWELRAEGWEIRVGRNNPGRKYTQGTQHAQERDPDLGSARAPDFGQAIFLLGGEWYGA